MFDEKASQAINPEVHSEWGRGPQSPDPPPFPNLPQATVMTVYMYLIDCHNSRVCLGMSTVVNKVLHHERFISPPMHNVMCVTVNPVV